MFCGVRSRGIRLGLGMQQAFRTRTQLRTSGQQASSSRRADRLRGHASINRGLEHLLIIIGHGAANSVLAGGSYSREVLQCVRDLAREER